MSNSGEAACISAGAISHERKGRMLLNAFTARAGNQDLPGCGKLVRFVNMFGHSDSSEGVLYCVSEDNGETWQERGIFDLPYQAAHERHMMRKITGDCLYDEQARVLVRIGTEMLWENGNFLSLFKKRRLFYTLSFDNGESWSDAITIVQHQEGFDRDRMFPGVEYGKNMITSLMKAHQIRSPGPNQGKLAIGVQIQLTDSDGQLFNPTGMGFFRSACLLGSWNPDKLRYDWELSPGFAEVEPEESTRGVFEPVIQELDNGRLIMVLRGSNSKRHDTIPGTKFICFSDDQGMTWSRPARLRYEDGELMYSSSCCPGLIRDRLGRLFFIGVINPDNPNGNLPRYPLCIASLHPETLTVRRDSVTVIDTRRPEHLEQERRGAKYPVDYSNHCAYLDEREHKIVVTAPFRPDLDRFDTVINRYEIDLRDF